MRQSYPGGPAGYEVDDAQQAAQLRAMRREDASVVDVRLSCSHAALYILENSASVHWRKLGIEGFFYILKRNSVPKYRMILRNQTDSGEGDFMHAIDDKIRFEVKDDTFFYQIGDNSIVRGLWFHDKGFMPKFVRELSAICAEMGLQCEGTAASGPIPASVSPEYNHAPGMAILGMLRKSEPVPPDANMHIQVSPNKVVPRTSTPLDMLRQELSAPMSVGNGQFMGISNALTQAHKTHQSHSEEQIGGRVLTNHFVSADDVRTVLMEMVSSDQFVSELTARLNRLSKR